MVVAWDGPVYIFQKYGAQSSLKRWQPEGVTIVLFTP